MKLEEYILPNWKKPKLVERKRLDNKIILLLLIDRTVPPPDEGRKNLLAVNKNNEILWIADLPSEMYDSYYDIEIREGKLFARSSNGFICEINIETGGILNKKIDY